MGVADSGMFGEVICSGQEREKKAWNENTSLVFYYLLLLYK